MNSYSAISNPSYWTKSKYGGPIVEQGTHFVDLSRYFGGDVNLATVQANSLGPFIFPPCLHYFRLTRSFQSGLKRLDTSQPRTWTKTRFLRTSGFPA